MSVVQIDEYLDIESMIGRFPQFSKNQLRWIVANKEKYKIACAIKRVGRKLYFHMPTFSSWLDAQDA